MRPLHSSHQYPSPKTHMQFVVMTTTRGNEDDDSLPMSGRQTKTNGHGFPRFPFLFRLLVAVPLAMGKHAWEPRENHRCNIRTLSLPDLFHEFGPNGLPPLYSSPVVIVTGTERNARLQSQTQRDTLVEQFPPNFAVTLSSSNSFSEHRRTVPLQQYLDEIAAAPETSLTQLSNETWYLFGDTYSEPWQNLLQSYQLPPCRTCQRDLSSLSFGIGNSGSGVQWHTHGPGFSEVLHGRKHWILYPPNHRPANMHKDQSSRQWMEEEYPRRAQYDPDFYECTLNPGDLIYFPDRWWHATINLDNYTTFLSTFTTEHNVEIDTANLASLQC